MTGAFMLVAVAAPATAQTSGGGVYHPPATNVEKRPAIAAFEGAQIDLAKDWAGATACIVARTQGVLECFRTTAELEAEASRLAAPPATSAGLASADVASSGCGAPLKLFANGGYGGRQVWFYDPGYWQNLGDYGFDNQTSGYITGSCYAHLAENSWGGGWWYPGYTGPSHGEPYMSAGWNDRVSSILMD